MRRAGFGVRLGAGAMDAVFMYLLQFAAGMCVIPLFVVSQRNGPPRAGSEGIFKVELALNAVVWTGYTLTEVFGAASPAKRLLKLRIASAAGGEAARSRKVVRWAIKYSPCSPTSSRRR